MSEAKVIFSYGGSDLTIQCSTDEPMKDICQKFAIKIDKNINSLIFLYGGNQLDFQKKFKEQANMIDKERSVMQVLVYKNENGQMICPKCGEKIKINTEKIDEIVTSINNMKDAINGSKLLIENIIKTSSLDSMNIQLKSVNVVLNTLNEDINKINSKLKNLLNENLNIENKFNKELKKDKIDNNFIIAEIFIKEEDIYKNIRILNSYEERVKTNPKLKMNNIYKNEEEVEQCEISINDQLIPFNYFHNFSSRGKYIIKYSFKNNINNTSSIFYECSSLTSIDLSNFNTDNVTNMASMFYGCSSLNSIDLSNFNTKNVTIMANMFVGCSSLTSINLSNFNTKNVTIMANMFYGCSSLTSINLSNFNTINVSDMSGMFYGCSSLNSINLLNFNTRNVINMNAMFNGCSSLTSINLLNFITNNVIYMSGMFGGCSSLTSINLSNFNTNNVTNMSGMFYGCSSLTSIDLSNFNIKKTKDIRGIFGGCKLLKKENIIINDKKILDDKRLFKEFSIKISY